MNKKKRKIDEAFDLTMIMSMVLSVLELTDVLKNDTDLCKSVKKVLEVIVGLLKDRVVGMQSEIDLLKQCINELEARNVELETENAEIPELKKKLAEIPEFRKKLAEVEAKNVEIEARNAKLMKQMIEANNRRDARIEKLEEKQLQNDNTPNNILSNFNSGAVHHEKLLEEKEMDSFLFEAHKKIVSSEIKSHKKKGMDELKHELFNPPSETDSSSSINHNIMTEVSETVRPEKFTCDDIYEALHHLAQLCDKAIDAEDRANRANQKEILCWCLYWKDFRNQLDEFIRSGGGKFGEKKARSILYDTITEQLSILRKKRSQELGANSITELTDAQFQEIIDYGISLEKLPPEARHVPEISETARPKKILPTSEENSDEVSIPTPPIPLAYASAKRLNRNSSDNSNEENWFDEEAFFKETNLTTVTPDDDIYFNETNDANTHNGDSNSCNEDSDPDSNSEEEMPDDSDDDGYNGYGGYNEYGECDKGYYYRDGRYERKNLTNDESYHLSDPASISWKCEESSNYSKKSRTPQKILRKSCDYHISHDCDRQLRN
ncbi:hypothetical protein C1646_777652 [Rhizophagus diaphanus]|nr:hypothetical protein C1646_777652 [Rhizophagus diaphanus] [Rhizophagus sp. MUCL 43196]